MAKDNLVLFGQEYDGVEHLIVKDEFGIDRDFIRPNNIMVISENNTYPVADCKQVDVQIPPQTGKKLQIAENGEFTPDTYSGEYYNEVVVQMATELTDEEITITENGTYKPSTGKMFSKVTVDVPCDTMIGYDNWGNPAMPYVDPNTGKLEIDDLPDHIKVTVPPTKTAYGLNEYIDYSGIEVRAYTKNDRIWNKQGYTNGIIPYNELILESVKTDGVINNNNGFPEQISGDSDAVENYKIDYIALVSEIVKLALNDMYARASTVGNYNVDSSLIDSFLEYAKEYDGLPAYCYYSYSINSFDKPMNFGYIMVYAPTLGTGDYGIKHEKNLPFFGDYTDGYYDNGRSPATMVCQFGIGFQMGADVNTGEIIIRGAYLKSSYAGFIGHPGYVAPKNLYPCVGVLIKESTYTKPDRTSDIFELRQYGNINATFPINNEYDSISVYVYNVSTNLYCGIDQPIKCSYTGHVIAVNNRESIHATYTGNGIFFAFAHNGNEMVFVAASERQNDMVTVKVEKKVDGQVTERNENYIWLTREYIYDGRTVYYTYSGFPTSYGTIQTVSPTTTSGQINLFKTYHERIAWAIVYGNKPCGKKKMELPVKWKRPGDRKILETTFEIEIQLPKAM